MRFNCRQQLEELEEEVVGARGGLLPTSVKFSSKGADSDSDDDGDDDDDEDESGDWRKLEADLNTDLRINEKDSDAFNAFLRRPGADEPRQTLADIIMAKIDEKKTEIDTQFTDAESLKKAELDPR